MSNKSNETWSLRHVLKFLEDPEYPSVGPHLKVMSGIGLWRKLNSIIGKFKQLVFFLTITFFLSQYIKCCINFSAESIKLILQYAPFHMGILKACLFQLHFHKWQKIIEYVSSIERSQLAENDKTQNEIINDYIKRNRRVSYFFWALGFFSNFSIFTEPYQRNQINKNGTSIYLYMFDGYTPFRKEPPGYYMAMGIQTVLGNIVTVYVVSWDTLVVSIMIFFAGQLKLSQLHCRQLVNVTNPVKSHDNIAKCHEFHMRLIKYHTLFNSLISPIMFVYLIVISVNLGVCIIEIVKIQDDLSTLVSSLMYLNACLIQLLLFYWYSNEVTIEILRASYSFYTLLNTTN